MASANHEKESIELHQAGLKVTYPRLKVLDIFESSQKKHLSADEIYRYLIDANVEIGLATVYRVLAQFEAVGLLVKSNLQPDKALYELSDGKHHDHLICIDCGRVVEFRDEVLEARKLSLSDQMGFDLEHHTMAIFCHCIQDECAHRSENKQRERRS